MNRTDLPSGTVTFLFTDIEGSTKLLHELGPRGFDSALIEHRRVLREVFQHHGGVEVDTQGDAFFYAFPDADGAVTAAHEGQEVLAAGPIRVRIGIHTGTPHVGAEGYIGPDVNMGARIGAAGHGGQVLLSKATFDLVDADVLDLGEHRLKDFDEPVWIYQLGTEPFPPLKTISNTNLPRPASSFVGREQELKEITAQLQNGARVLTMTGPGGTGKTRLSIEAASLLVPEFRNGVFWVPLAPLRDPSLVPITIAQTLGAQDEVAKHIGDKQMLLVLDNFEQVIDAAPELTPLVEACPNLRMLVTSRELLRLSGEVEYPVPPLERNEAVELFSRRSGREPDATIAELCERLDHLPLAVELAAARTSVLTPAQILERLSQRLDLLKGGRDAEARQQTLRTTIAWSFDLLDDDEKRLFARLAVFRGGCTLESAEEVADADLDILQSLVDKSLVRHTGDRFWMLETIREFATEQLAASSELEHVRSRHADYFVAFAVNADRQFRRAPADWLDQLDRDHDNFRAVLDHLEDTGETQRTLEVVSGLWRLWHDRGPLLEGRRRIESALGRDAQPTAALAFALSGASALACASGNAEDGLKHGERAITIARELDDPEALAFATLILGGALTDLDDFARARPLFEESRTRFNEIGADHAAGIATLNLSYALRELGEAAKAEEIASEGLERARRGRNRRNEAGFLAELAIQALDLHERPHDAISLLKQSLEISMAEGLAFFMGRELYRLGRAHAAAGSPEVGTRLLAAAVKMYEDMNAGEEWFWDYVERTKTKLRENLDEETFRRLWQKREGAEH
ncbi:MAG: ATP-binding protein [Actinomycetota bacterium]